MEVEAKIELTEHEIDYLKKVHNARALKELMQHPGWAIYTGVVKDMIARLENKHLAFARDATRDAYWASGLRLGAAREFAFVLEAQIAQAVGILEQPLRVPERSNPADYDGYIPRNGQRPEGDE